jgi:hypothetical protein
MRRFLPRRATVVAALALTLALAAPLSAPRAADADCESLDIGLSSRSGFSEITCSSGGSGGGGLSETEEGIFAKGAAKFFVVRHAAAGVRTYYTRVSTRQIIDSVSAFSKIENWGAAPGGNQFEVARFNGQLKDRADLPLACFAFSRFTSHVDRSTSGFRHILYGFYCVAVADQIPDAEIRRLIASITFSFE